MLTPKRLSLVCALFVCLIFVGFARAGGDEWREVTPAELQMKTPKVEADADAEAIFWEVRIDDSSEDSLTQRHYIRVKIFSDRGREKFSKVDIPFTRGMKIKDLMARVIKPDGTIVEITGDDIFEREIVKANGIKIKAKSFAVPNIEPGVIIEYKYKQTVQDAGAKGMRLQFQRDIPVETISYYYKPYNNNTPRYQNYNFTDVKFVKDKGGYYLAQRMDVPSLKEEPNMPPENNVRAWMLLTGSSLSITGTSGFSINFSFKDPSSPSLYWGGVSADWGPIAKLMSKPSDDVKAAAEQIVAGAVTPEDRLRKIYDYCQTQISNTTFDPKITDEQRAKLPQTKSVNDVLKRKSASAMFVDLLFGTMAKALGFETRVALMSDRSEMVFEPNMTNEAFIHPGGIGVKINNDWKVYNPGSKFAPFGVLPWYEEGGWTMLVAESEYLWIQTPLTDYAASKIRRKAVLNLLDDGSLEGTVSMEYSGQPALTYRLDNYDEDAAKLQKDFADELKTKMSTAEISNVSIENVLDDNKPLVKKYTINMPGYAQKTGKRLFFQPGFFEYGSNARFSGGDRKYDIFFQYPWSETDSVEITYPKSFDLESPESPGVFGDPQKISLLDIKIGVDPKTDFVQYKREFHFGGNGAVYFTTRAYPSLKNLFDAFNKMDAYSLTLKQKG
jgi:hypothetical protein